MLNSREYDKRAHNAYLSGNSWAGSAQDDISDVSESNISQSFKPDHHQANTHAIQVNIYDNSRVPNFVGGCYGYRIFLIFSFPLFAR